jgi:hypothetical protein
MNAMLKRALVGFCLLCLSCSSGPIVNDQELVPVEVDREKLMDRDFRYGPNRAFNSGVSQKTKDYVFRNVASAFPDNGKKMLIKPIAKKKDQVQANSESAPWYHRVSLDTSNEEKNRQRFSTPNKAAYQLPISEETAERLSKTSDPIRTPASFYQLPSDQTDDGFEPNSEAEKATNISAHENRWLAFAAKSPGLVSEGIQWDPDFYRINVSPLFRQLKIDLRYQHYMGNIDLTLMRTDGSVIAKSHRSGDDEFLNIVLKEGGDYFILVDGLSKGNRYDFLFQTEFTGQNDDLMEENDSLRTAFDLSTFSGIWLSEKNGEGIAADDDFFKIKVPIGKTRVQVDLRYRISGGDIDLVLMNAKGEVLASSSSIQDDEFIDFDVRKPGFYYLRIYPFAPPQLANMYDLKWTASESHKSLFKLGSSRVMPQSENMNQ